MSRTISKRIGTQAGTAVARSVAVTLLKELASTHLIVSVTEHASLEHAMEAVAAEHSNF